MNEWDTQQIIGGIHVLLYGLLEVLLRLVKLVLQNLNLPGKALRALFGRFAVQIAPLEFRQLAIHLLVVVFQPLQPVR